MTEKAFAMLEEGLNDLVKAVAVFEKGVDDYAKAFGNSNAGFKGSPLDLMLEQHRMFCEEVEDFHRTMRRNL